MEKYFKISRSKEYRDIKTLIKMLKPIITEDTVICNCSPDYSSIISQQVAHVYFDNPLEMPPFEMPFPNTPFEKVYDLHCKDFAEKLEANTHYVFIDSGILRGRNFKSFI